MAAGRGQPRGRLIVAADHIRRLAWNLQNFCALISCSSRSPGGQSARRGSDLKSFSGAESLAMRFEELKNRVRNLPTVSAVAADARDDRACGPSGVDLRLGASGLRLPGGGRTRGGCASCGGGPVLLADQHPSGRRHARRGAAGGFPLSRNGAGPPTWRWRFRPPGIACSRRPTAPAAVRAALQSSFAQMSIATCMGQELDARELASEGSTGGWWGRRRRRCSARRCAWAPCSAGRRRRSPTSSRGRPRPRPLHPGQRRRDGRPRSRRRAPTGSAVRTACRCSSR